MKLIQIFLLLFSCIEITLANDFRVLDFGDECENIDKLELKLGSQIIIRDEAYLGSFEYQGLKISDKAFIYYRCTKEGVFLEGAISVATESIQEAEKKFNEVHKILINIHGPSKEMISSDVKERYPSFGSIKGWNLSGYHIRLHGTSNLVAIVFSR
jgi:hypothetical protein